MHDQRTYCHTEHTQWEYKTTGKVAHAGRRKHGSGLGRREPTLNRAFTIIKRRSRRNRNQACDNKVRNHQSEHNVIPGEFPVFPTPAPPQDRVSIDKSHVDTHRGAKRCHHGGHA